MCAKVASSHVGRSMQDASGRAGEELMRVNFFL